MNNKLIQLVANWREASQGFAKNQRLMETSPHDYLHREAKLQQGWKEALKNCADKLEATLNA